jgi:hypothetical protein
MPTIQKKIFKYKDGVVVKVPLTELIAGPGVTITREVDDSSFPTDVATISSTPTGVAGTANQIHVETSGSTKTLSLEEELILPGSKISFAQVIAGSIPALLPAYSLFFHEVDITT